MGVAGRRGRRGASPAEPAWVMDGEPRGGADSGAHPPWNPYGREMLRNAGWVANDERA